MRERPVVLRKRRERIKSEANWKLFYFQFTRDHAILNLIWNHQVKPVFQNVIIFLRVFHSYHYLLVLFPNSFSLNTFDLIFRQEKN